MSRATAAQPLELGRPLNDYELVLCAICDQPRSVQQISDLLLAWKGHRSNTLTRNLRKAVDLGVAVIDEQGRYSEPDDHFSESRFGRQK